MNRIAVVRTCALGDAVQCTPLLQQIKADEPEAKLTLFTSDNAVPLFEGAGFLDAVIPLRADWLSIKVGRRGMLRAWWEVARHGPFDAMISLESTWLRNAGSVLVDARAKAGLSFVETRKPYEPFTHPLRISGDSRKAMTHAAKLYLQLWRGMSGSDDRGFGYNLRHLVAPGEKRRRICIAPGTGNAFSRIDTKQWPVSRFLDLGQQLISEGYEVAYVGGADDLNGRTIPKGAANELGKTTVREIATLLHHSAALVANDSGLFHLAQGVGCPALGLFGPTSPRLTGVFRTPHARALHVDLPCMPCYQHDCRLTDTTPKPCCMNALTVERVRQELQWLL